MNGGIVQKRIIASINKMLRRMNIEQLEEAFRAIMRIEQWNGPWRKF